MTDKPTWMVDPLGKHCKLAFSYLPDSCNCFPAHVLPDNITDAFYRCVTDGTTNFVHRFPFVCVSIALAINKEVNMLRRGQPKLLPVFIMGADSHTGTSSWLLLLVCKILATAVAQQEQHRASA